MVHSSTARNGNKETVAELSFGLRRLMAFVESDLARIPSVAVEQLDEWKSVGGDC